MFVTIWVILTSLILIIDLDYFSVVYFLVNNLSLFYSACNCNQKNSVKIDCIQGKCECYEGATGSHCSACSKNYKIDFYNNL